MKALKRLTHYMMHYGYSLSLRSLIAGTGNALVLSLSRISTWSHFMRIWPTWVLGDLSAILCYTPCILHLWNLFHEDFKTFCWGRSKPMKACQRLCKLGINGKPSLSTWVEENTTDSYVMQSDIENVLHNESSLTIWNSTDSNTVPGYCQSCNRVTIDGCNECTREKCIMVNTSRNICERIPENYPGFSIRLFLIRLMECMVLFLILTALSMFIFFNLGAPTNEFVQHLSYLVFPVVIWASFRFNRVGLPLSVVVVAVIASGGTAKHHGALYHDDNNDNSLLQVKHSAEKTKRLLF